MARAVDGGSDPFQTILAGRDRLTSAQSTMVERAPEEQREFLKAQFKLENESQITEILTRLLKGDSDDAMAILRNLA